jgi:preprotein translocase subunit SecE
MTGWIVLLVVVAALAGLGYWLWRAGHGQRTQDFLRETRTEMKKVSFPPRDEVTATTVIVIITSFVFAVYLWAVDLIIHKGYEWIINRL